MLEHIRLNSRITSSKWNAERSKWVLVVSPKGEKHKIVEGDVFINAAGILNQWEWPDIPGLDIFKGPKLHTANWVCQINLFNIQV